MQNSRINSKLKWKNRNAHSNLIEQSNKTLDNSIYLFYFPTLLSRISKPDLRKQTCTRHTGVSFDNGAFRIWTYSGRIEQVLKFNKIVFVRRFVPPLAWSGDWLGIYETEYLSHTVEGAAVLDINTQILHTYFTIARI